MFNLKLFFVTAYIYLLYLFSGLFLITPITILNIINPKIGFFIKNIYYTNLGFILKYFMQTEVFVNSNTLIKELFNESCQVITTQNHFTEIDYLFLSYFFTNLESFTKMLKFKFMFVAKKMVGYVFTGIGLFSLFSKDLYLNRDINYDYLTIKSHNNSNLLYIFPEGTCYNNFTKKKSDEFVKNNNLIKYKYHLYPRLTGLFTLLKNHHKYKRIYDLTVMYDTILKNDLGNVYKFYHFYYKYDFPTRVFINIKKYDIDNITNFDKKIEYIFNKKDLFIKNFDINHNQFHLSNYNFFIGFNCFMISLLIFIYSLYLFLNYSFIKTLYSSQLVLYFIHFYFFF